MTGQVGLVSCIVCGSYIDTLVKQGILLRTKCRNCGTSSESLNNDKNKKDKQEVQVYYKKKAPKN